MLNQITSVAAKIMTIVPGALQDVAGFEQKIAADKTLAQKLTDAFALAEEALAQLSSQL